MELRGGPVSRVVILAWRCDSGGDVTDESVAPRGEMHAVDTAELLGRFKQGGGRRGRCGPVPVVVDAPVLEHACLARAVELPAGEEAVL